MTRSLVTACVVAQLACGCAAVGHTFGERSSGQTNLVYAGTRSDVRFLTLQEGYDGEWRKIAAIVVWPLALADFPFSLVGDTVLLPYTIPESIRREARQAKQDTAP